MKTLHVREALTPDGWARDVRLSIDGTHIAAVSAPAAPEAGDERHAIALPGIANLHCHAFQRGMAGLAETRGPTLDTFWTWRETMYRFALAMSPEDAEAVALLLYCEMLEAGFTRVGEFHYLHHDRDGRPYGDIAEMAVRITAAASAAGIGLTLLPCFYAHAGFGGTTPHAGQRRFICSLDQFARLHQASAALVARIPGANIGVAPHSLRAVTPAELRDLVGLADHEPIHIHVAEQVKEVEDCSAWSGARPVEWLLANASVDTRWCLVHATHMTEEETTALARTGATAGLCPVTEASLGDGIFPTRGYLDRGGRFGVGTDSNVLVGVCDELRQLEYAQRLSRRERNVLAAGPTVSTGRALLEAAGRGGAQALGQSSWGLAEGARADIVTLASHHPSIAGRSGDKVLDGWIFSAGAAAVDCVWAGGEKCVEAGRHRMRDEARRRFNAAIAGLVA